MSGSHQDLPQDLREKPHLPQRRGPVERSYVLRGSFPAWVSLIQLRPSPRGHLIWRPSLFLTSLSLLGPQRPSFSCSLVTPETHQPRPSNGHSVQGPAAPPGSTQEEDTMDTARLAPSPSLPFGLSFLLIWGTLFRLRRQEALLAQHLCPASGLPPGPILGVTFSF